MEEQSDTPRTDAAAQFVSHFGWQVHADFARALERELATATRERDEARAIANDRDAMVDHRDRALTAMYQRVDVITQERDEARAEVAELEVVLRASGALNQKLLDEVDRLRALTICGCGDHFAIGFEGTCPNCIAAGKEPKP
jgi:hypothetical protein